MLFSSIGSSIIAIIMALLQFGVMSLVVQNICFYLFRTGCFWLVDSWRPSFLFSFQSLRNLLGYGKNLMYANLLYISIENIHYLVIGKLYPFSDLGFYSFARVIQHTLINSIIVLVERVIFPVYATLQNNPTQLKMYFRKTITTLSMICFPMMIGLIVVANPFIQIILTEKWIPSVHYLKLLCVVGMIVPLYMSNITILKALGRTDLYFQCEFYRCLLMGLSILITYRFGIVEMIYGHIVAVFLGYCIIALYTYKLLDYKLIEQLVDIVPYLISSLVMGLLVYTVGILLQTDSLTSLLAMIVSGMTVYIFLCSILRLHAFLNTYETICNALKTGRLI
jgi:O-antigen/teichoic acid export membrane protein